MATPRQPRVPGFVGQQCAPGGVGGGSSGGHREDVGDRVDRGEKEVCAIVPEPANQVVPDRGNLFGQRRRDGDEVGQPGPSHRGARERDAQAPRGDGGPRCPGQQNNVVARQGHRPMRCGLPGACTVLSAGDHLHEIALRTVGYQRHHDSSDRAVDDCVDHTGDCAQRTEHLVGDGIRVRSGQAADFDPVTGTLSAAAPGRWASDRLDGHGRDRVCRGPGTRNGVEHECAGASRRAATHCRDRADEAPCCRCGSVGSAEPGEAQPGEHSGHRTRQKLMARPTVEAGRGA